MIVSKENLSAGHYVVRLYNNSIEVGNFTTTDMQLIDDIDEMNSGGFETSLTMFESFEEVLTYCVDRYKDKLSSQSCQQR